MNMISRPHDNDNKDCGCNKINQASVISKCKVGPSVSIPSLPIVAPAAVNILANLSLNTEHLCNPCIKFEFSSNLVSILGPVTEEPIVISSVTVSFQLYKLCKFETIPVAIGSPWVYSLSNPLATTLTTSNIVTFIVCDCYCDCDTAACCSYYVQASTIGTGTASITFNNSTLSALVVEDQRHCC